MVAEYCYPYPRPMVTVDSALFGMIDENPSILLIKRKNEPCCNMWAFPGGFVEPEEELHAAAHRELEEETGVTCTNLFQMGAIGTPGRDPRGRTITIVYSGYQSFPQTHIFGSDATDAQWFSCEHLPRLAFDHALILQFVMCKWLDSAMFTQLFPHRFKEIMHKLAEENCWKASFDRYGIL
ncbi:NUDIX hydrolase [bacterium]|nr:NUDIX hydrolase [bacterium]MCP5462635.1 NUDIX hydrolase [bacterium]